MRKTILPILLAFCGLAASQFAAANENILRREHAQQMNRIGHCMQVYGNATCTDYSPSSSSYSRPSYDSPSVSSSYTPPSPEELARINNWLRLNETRTPKHCTPVADRMQRCWEGNYHPMPADSKHPAIRPLVKLYTLDDKGNIQGHELEYSRQTNKLLWTTFYRDGQPNPKDSAAYNFYDAPAGQVGITKISGSGGWSGKQRITETAASQAQGLSELGLKSINLRDTMHPDDYRQLLKAEQQIRQLEDEFKRKGIDIR